MIVMILCVFLMAVSAAGYLIVGAVMR